MRVTRQRIGTICVSVVLAFGAGGCSAIRGNDGDAALGVPPGESRQAEGARIFATRCAVCHVVGGGEGHPQDPDLTRSRTARDEERVARVVRYGQGVMPAFDDELTDEQIDAVASYVAAEIADRVDEEQRSDLENVPDI